MKRLPAPPDDVFFASISDLSRRLRAREFSAVDLVKVFSERLQRLGPALNALALALPKQAMRAAKEVDDDLKRERFRGPLQGIPFGVKDVFALAGQTTAWGAKPYESQVFDSTATVVDKLHKSSALLIGKLSMVALGGAGNPASAASISGPGRNPWNQERWSGGSSSGSAAAVAAGLVPFALGSETLGSLLGPSAYCGVTAIRPTYGLVSRSGAMAVSWSMDKVGPVARSVDDCGLVLHGIAGADGKDPGSAGKSFYYTPQYTRKMSEIKVGVLQADFEQGVEAAERPVFAKALDVLRGLGLQIAPLQLPDMPYAVVARTIVDAEASSAFQTLIETGGVDKLTDARQMAGLRAGLEIPSKDYLKSMRIRTMVQEAFHRIFGEVDVLLAPTMPGIAPRLSDLPGAADIRPLTAAGNLAGLPGLSVPCGFVDGMPLGLSLVGGAYTENTLLGVGREFQKVTDWHTRRPPV